VNITSPAITTILTVSHLTVSFFINLSVTHDSCTLSLHDALPISFITREIDFAVSELSLLYVVDKLPYHTLKEARKHLPLILDGRSEEHTSELQSHLNLVCRLLLEKKKTKNKQYNK